MVLAACGAPGPSSVQVVASGTSNAVAVPLSHGAPRQPASTSPVVQISAGMFHACARHADGTVSCWGDNTAGQIGDLASAYGSASNMFAHAESAPVAVPLDHVLEIAAGATRTCARRADGVWCWGAPARPPERIDAPTDLVQITDSCGRTAAGEVWCWDDTLAAGREPRLEHAVGLASTRGNTCAVADDHGIQCISPDPGYIRDATRWIAGAVEVEFTTREICARLESGGVECWRLEQFYDGFDRPGAPAAKIPDLTDAVQVAMSYSLSCARTVDRRVRCWGEQYGTGYYAHAPATIPGLAADELVAGYDFICARDGSAVWCFGDNRYGELGIGVSGLQHTPRAIVGIDDAVDVMAGDNFSCARRRTGAVACWGGMLDRLPTASPVDVAGADGAVELAGVDQLCMRFADGHVGCDNGISVEPIAGMRDLVSLSAARTHRVGRTRDGALRSSGSNLYGQFGTGTAENDTDEVATAVDLTGTIAAGAGENATCFVRAGGTVACLGETFESRGVGWEPLEVAGIERAVDVAVGQRFACALIADGTVECWGSTTTGALGRPMTGIDMRPQPVPGITDAVQIIASPEVVCVRRRAGTVACWGANDAAIIADANVVDWTDRPLDIGLAGVVDVAVSLDHACAVLATGTVECWGMTFSGQLGVVVPTRAMTKPKRVQFPTPRD